MSGPPWLDCGLRLEVGTSLTILTTRSGYIRYSGEKNDKFGRWQVRGNSMVLLAATPALSRPSGSLHVECPSSSGGSFGP